MDEQARGEPEVAEGAGGAVVEEVGELADGRAIRFFSWAHPDGEGA